MIAGRTFVGFGMGPIQAGLFLHEALASGNFSRLVVAEIDPAIVAAVRAAGGRCRINIARRDRIDVAEFAGLELYNPGDRAGDRERLVEAIAQADEMATALPSVAAYAQGGEDSPAALLAEAIARRDGNSRPPILYAAENHNHAAELLTQAINAQNISMRPRFQALNTVIGKMSGVVSDPAVIRDMKLATLTPSLGRAILVEEFNRILISRVRLPGVARGIAVFEEKDDLLPFEEAKLYGHNAIHALVGYLGELRGHRAMPQAGADERVMAVARGAFLSESAAAMLHRHARAGEALFTPEGYRAYALDLLDRMIRPTLCDLVARVTRDHARKLGRDDRLFGAMRLALEAGVRPVNLAIGAAAGVLSMIRRRGELTRPLHSLPAGPRDLTPQSLRAALLELWDCPADARADELIEMTWRAMQEVMRWQA